MKISKFHTLTAGSILLCLSTLTQAVDFSTSRTVPSVFADAVLRSIPLNDAGSTELSVFINSTATRLVLFNAECSVSAADTLTWYDINLQIISPTGVVTTLAPSNNDNAFCTSHGNNVQQNWSSNETNGVFFPSVSGVYRVRVQGQLIGFSAGESVRIDDISLVITQ